MFLLNLYVLGYKFNNYIFVLKFIKNEMYKNIHIINVLFLTSCFNEIRQREIREIFFNGYIFILDCLLFVCEAITIFLS